jgi:hypothetical protein
MLLTPVSQDSNPFSTQAIVSGPPLVPRSTESLHTLMKRHIAMLNLEEVVCGSTAADANMTDSTATEKRKIVDCFDFSSDTWTMFFQRSAMGSLEDKMELYDLLDLDAEEDLDYDIDDCVESILTS